MREMMRHRHHLVRLRKEERALCHDFAVVSAHVAFIKQAHFQLVDRQDVAIAHDQIDVVERDALGPQAIIDGIFKKAASVLFTRNAFFFDAEGDFAVAQQADADVVIIGVDAEDVVVFFFIVALPARDAVEARLQY